MRRILSTIATLVAIGALVATAIAVWRRNPRLGTRFVNAIVNPGLLRLGLVGRGGSELGTLEHVGRRSGLRRLTPVRPEPTTEGFRIVVPLGSRSEWAQNVVAAGHCRLQLHDVVYELDEPSLVSATEVENLPRLVRRVEEALGFRYLLLRQFAAAPGSLVDEGSEAATQGELGSGPTSPPVSADLVASTH